MINQSLKLPKLICLFSTLFAINALGIDAKELNHEKEPFDMELLGEAIMKGKSGDKVEKIQLTYENVTPAEYGKPIKMSVADVEAYFKKNEIRKVIRLKASHFPQGKTFKLYEAKTDGTIHQKVEYE